MKTKQVLFTTNLAKAPKQLPSALCVRSEHLLVILIMKSFNFYS